MLSIIVPFYNKGSSLLDTLDSFLEQSSDDFEIIIVDDGSETVPDLKKYFDVFSNFKYIKQDNAGVSAARNAGAEKAKFDWLCFIDAGDTVSIDFFEVFKINALKLNDVEFFSSNFSFIKNKLKSTANLDINSDIYIDKFKYYSELINGKYLMHICSVFVKAAVFKEIKGFTVGKTHGEDHEFIIRLLNRNSGFYYIFKPLFNYHLDDESSVTKTRKYQPIYAHILYLSNNYDFLSLIEKKYMQYTISDFLVVNLRRLKFFKALRSLRKNNIPINFLLLTRFLLIRVFKYVRK